MKKATNLLRKIPGSTKQCKFIKFEVDYILVSASNTVIYTLCNVYHNHKTPSYSHMCENDGEIITVSQVWGTYLLSQAV